MVIACGGCVDIDAPAARSAQQGPKDMSRADASQDLGRADLGRADLGLKDQGRDAALELDLGPDGGVDLSSMPDMKPSKDMASCGVEACKLGQALCTDDGSAPASCELREGCPAVVPGPACIAGLRCEAGQCVCDQPCTPGQHRCTGQTLEECVQRAPCPQWVTKQACDVGLQLCNAQAKRCDCRQTCAPGGTSCANSNLLSLCELDAQTQCPKARTESCDTRLGVDAQCVNGGCVACAEQCRAGQQRCNAGRVERCIKTTNDSCPRWSSGQSCSDALCTGGANTCANVAQCSVCGMCLYCPN